MTGIELALGSPDHRPALVSVPRLDATGGGWTVYAPNRALWLSGPDRGWRLPLPGPWSTATLPDGVLAWSVGGVTVVARREVEVVEDPRIRVGGDLRITRAPGGPWTAEGWSLPEGPAWSRSLRPLPAGRALAWEADGYVYTWRVGESPRALARATEFHLDPAGQVVPGPAPLQDPAIAEIPADATRVREDHGGIPVVASRPEGSRIRAWTRDGVELLVRR